MPTMFDTRKRDIESMGLDLMRFRNTRIKRGIWQSFSLCPTDTKTR